MVSLMYLLCVLSQNYLSSLDMLPHLVVGIDNRNTYKDYYYY